MGRIIIYFRKAPLKDRWFYGDRLLRSVVHFFRKKKKGSLDIVFENLLKGFDLIGTKYLVNLPFKKVKSSDQLIFLGNGRHVLKNYNLSNKFIAGIGLMTHPSEWVNLFTTYPIAFYFQHSYWPASIYRAWYGENSVRIWPSGIDTEYWKPKENAKKKHILIYQKFLWDRQNNEKNLLEPIFDFLEKQEISYEIIKYGQYVQTKYKTMLQESTGMIFLCEHESQGLAYQEAMSMNVPIFAWNQGLWLDPNQLEWQEKLPIDASSTPYFNAQCGMTFSNLNDFINNFKIFKQQVEKGLYSPRAFVLKNLSLQKSAEIMMRLLKEAYQ